MLGREPSSGHPRKPEEGPFLTHTSQTFMENCSVPGTMLVTGDTEMNRTHCPLILLLPCPPLSLSGPSPSTWHWRGHQGQNHKGRGLALEPGGQKTWVLIHHPQTEGQRCSPASVSSLQHGEVGPDGPLVLTTGDEYTPPAKGFKLAPKSSPETISA